MSGKYFILISKLNGLVLDVEKCQSKPGTPVIMYLRKDKNNNNQQWYYDHGTSTIKSRLNNFCLDTNKKGELVVNPYHRGVQEFYIDEKRSVIHRKQAPNEVVDIKGGQKDPGAKLCMWQYKGNWNQLWTFEYMPPAYFYIISEMNGMALQVKDEDLSRKSGQRVCTGPLSGTIHQQWYESKSGISSRFNHKPLTSIVVREKAPMMLQEAVLPEPIDHYWTLSGNKIINLHNMNFVCDIKDSTTGAMVIAYPYKGSANQHWRVDYIK